MGFASYLEDIQRRLDEALNVIRNIPDSDASRPQFDLGSLKRHLLRLDDSTRFTLEKLHRDLDYLTDPQLDGLKKLEAENTKLQSTVKALNVENDRLRAALEAAILERNQAIKREELTKRTLSTEKAAHVRARLASEKADKHIALLQSQIRSERLERTMNSVPEDVARYRR